MQVLLSYDSLVAGRNIFPLIKTPIKFIECEILRHQRLRIQKQKLFGFTAGIINNMNIRIKETIFSN